MKKSKEPRFYVELTYDGHDVSFDYTIENKIGREASTGYSLFDGRRCIVFYFYYENATKKALNKLKRFKKYNARAELVKCEEQWTQD